MHRIERGTKRDIKWRGKGSDEGEESREGKGRKESREGVPRKKRSMRGGKEEKRRGKHWKERWVR